MSTSVNDRWKKLRALTLRELRWLGTAWFALPCVRALVSVLGYERTKRLLEPILAGNRRLSEEQVVELARLVRAAASNHLFRANCLTQSLWLTRSLRQHGVPCDVRFGVMSVHAGRLQAHAWVEADDRRLNEPVEIEKQATPFMELDAPRIAARAL